MYGRKGAVGDQNKGARLRLFFSPSPSPPPPGEKKKKKKSRAISLVRTSVRSESKQDHWGQGKDGWKSYSMKREQWALSSLYS